MACYLINICSLYTQLVYKSFFGVASVQLICLVHKLFTDPVLEFNSLNQWFSCGSSWAELTGGEDYRWIIFIFWVNYSFKSLTQLPIAGLYPFSSIWIRVKQSSVQVCSWFSPHSTTNPRPSAPISDVRQEQMEVLSALHVSAVVRKCVCYQQQHSWCKNPYLSGIGKMICCSLRCHRFSFRCKALTLKLQWMSLIHFLHLSNMLFKKKVYHNAKCNSTNRYVHRVYFYFTRAPAEGAEQCFQNVSNVIYLWWYITNIN